MMEFLAVGIGGFVGCCMRFAFIKLFQPFFLQFPLATLASNVVAGFFVGLFNGLDRETNWITPKIKLFLTTGAMGGLSTFSTFSMETIDLFSQKRYMSAAGNILLNLALGLSGVIAGMALAKSIRS